MGEMKLPLSRRHLDIAIERLAPRGFTAQEKVVPVVSNYISEVVAKPPSHIFSTTEYTEYTEKEGLIIPCVPCIPWFCN